MAVSYKKLFHLLIDKEISTTELQQRAEISANIISRLKKNESVSLDTIEKICSVLGCTTNDILDFIENQSLEETK